MEAVEVVRLLDLLEGADLVAWLDGGWGVDALFERQTRSHDDLDLVVEFDDLPRMTAILDAAGYEVIAGGAPKSFVAVDGDGRQVDVHPIVFGDAGGGVYQMDEGRAWKYPSAGFSGRGRVAGRSVCCLTPEVQVLVHDGYELTDKGYRELYQSHARFGVDLPQKYDARALEVKGL